MIETLMTELGPWSWWIGGIILLGLEIFVPGTFFLWFGVAALLVGTLGFFVPMGFGLQISIWVAASMVLLLIGRRFFKREVPSGDPLLNDRLAQFTGRAFTLGEPIVEGEGRLKIGDTIWRVTGPDLPAGSKVTVTGAAGTALSVTRAE
jgi:inner membrane protein